MSVKHSRLYSIVFSLTDVFSPTRLQYSSYVDFVTICTVVISCVISPGGFPSQRSQTFDGAKAKTI